MGREEGQAEKQTDLVNLADYLWPYRQPTFAQRKD
jgi:hypothetical protein